jgi:hypothetical protein
MVTPTSPFSRGLISQTEDVQLLDEYLNKRTLEPSDFPMGLIPMREPGILRERGYAHNVAAGRPFIFLRYLKPDGTPYYKNKDPYELVRFLGPVKMWKGKEDPPKAISPSGRPPVLHFEPIGGGQDWSSLPDGTVVLHVESMIKAKVVHKWLPDNPCVGLNGVWGWASSKMGVELTYVDTGVDFSRFKNVILFDSNTHNPKVNQARNSLAFKLRNVLGCKEVYLAELPRPSKLEYDDPDWGPDDFLRVKADPNQLVDVINAATPFVGSLDDPLIDAIKDKIVYCTSTSAVIDREFKDVMDTTHAKERYLPINRKELRGKATVTTYAFKLWQEDAEARRSVRAPCYRYLGEEFVEKSDGEYYNLYVKSGTWPVEGYERTGAAEPIITQLHNMFGEAGVERFRSYFRFLKFTSGKPSTLLVVYGSRGHGKGWITRLMDRVMGNANPATARGRELSSNFNALLGCKRLLIFNDYNPEGSEQTALNAIKTLSGDEFIVIEQKGMDAYRIESNAGAIFTTNFLDQVPTDGLEDRRLIYLDATNRTLLTPSQWELLHEMYEDPEVLEDFTQWLKEGEEVNYCTWKPDPLDHDRQAAILASSSGTLKGTARMLLQRLRDDPAGYVCAWAVTLRTMFEEEGHDLSKYSNTRFANVLVHGDWVGTGSERFGRNKQQAAVYIIDPVKFEAMRSDKIAVRDEADRLASDLVIPPKF